MSAMLVVPAVAASLIFSSIAMAHDLKGASKEKNASASPEVAQALATIPIADLNTRSVLNNLRLWPVPRQITICFLSGSAELRKRVADSARKIWPLRDLTDARLDFDATSFNNPPDCSSSPASDIRVEFKAGDGHWSYVGIESLKYNPSMNFDKFIEEPPAPGEFDRLIGHEFGHALGLEHEHQSPGGKKCEWDFNYIYKTYSWKSEKEMHDNLDALHDYIQKGKHAYVFSTYDRTSIMHYKFEPVSFLDGNNDPCYIKVDNKVPSSQDRDALRVAYGPGILASQGQTKSLAPDIMRTIADPSYDRLRELLDLKVKLMGQ